MCLAKPNIPTPDPVQEKKDPSTSMLQSSARKNRAGMTGGSLLTSPSGVANAAASTGKNTLLGG